MAVNVKMYIYNNFKSRKVLFYGTVSSGIFLRHVVNVEIGSYLIAVIYLIHF